jgi:hypothetical protein
MEIARKAYVLWETVRMVMFGCILCFLAGMLSGGVVRSHMSISELVPVVIMPLVVLGIFATVCIVGIRRWKRGQLGPDQKVYLCGSIVLFVVVFTTGWCTHALEH